MEARLAENKMASVDLWQDDIYFCLRSTLHKLSELPLGKSLVISHEMPPEGLACRTGRLTSNWRESGHSLKSG